MRETHTETAEAPSAPAVSESRARRRSDTAADRTSARPAPDPHDIEMRAYELYLERGRSDGDDVGDWLRAERELELR